MLFSKRSCWMFYRLSYRFWRFLRLLSSFRGYSTLFILFLFLLQNDSDRNFFYNYCTFIYFITFLGEKHFFMLPPTPENLLHYENWVKNKSQRKVFFSDLCSDAPIKIIVKPGSTLLLPSGWIHSVYTPVDSVVRKNDNKMKAERKNDKIKE